MAEHEPFRTLYQRFAQDLARRDNGFFCRYCGASLIPPGTPADVREGLVERGYQQGSVDHVIPRRKGGTDDLLNMVLACMDCNKRKGSRSFARFPFFYLQRRETQHDSQDSR